MIKRYALFSARHTNFHRLFVTLLILALLLLTAFVLQREAIEMMPGYIPLIALVILMGRVATYKQRYLAS